MTGTADRMLARRARRPVPVRTIQAVTIVDDPLGADRILRAPYFRLPEPLRRTVRELAHGDGPWRCPNRGVKVGHRLVHAEHPASSWWAWEPVVIVAEGDETAALCLGCGRLPEVAV